MKTLMMIVALCILSAPALAAPKEKAYIAAEFYGEQFEKDGFVCRGGGDIDSRGDVSIYERCHDHYVHLYELRVGDVVYIIGGNEALIGTLKGIQVSMRFSKDYQTVFVVTRYGKEAHYHLMPGTFHVK